MNTLPYLDIHTHRREKRPDSVSIACLSTEELLLESTPLDFASAGIHPWWTEDYSKDEIQNFKVHVEHLLQDKKLWAVGESGIDRAYPELLDIQKELFLWHLKMSEQYSRPLIIHSVRAGADFLQILKEKTPKMPWIFHDFRGNETLMKDLLRLHPECYFSFGLSIDNSPQIRDLLPLVPLSNLFFETDEQKHLDIHDIYLRGSHFLGIDP